MIPEQYREMINTLHNKSKDDEVNWGATSESDLFIVSFPKVTVAVQSYYDEDNDKAVKIQLMNKEGRLLDEFSDYEREHDDWNKLSEIFNSARRKALKLDEAIRNISQELDKPGPIGSSGSEDPF